MAAFPELSGRLSDGVVELRAVAEWDIPDILIAFQDDPHMHLALGDARPPTGAELGRAVERAPVEAAAGTRLKLTIVEPGGEDCRGRLGVHAVDWEHARAELGIWVAPALRGRGVARRALRLGARWLFEACGLERLGLLTTVSNEPMLRAALAAGFVREGVLRSYERDPDGRVDMVSLSLLPGDL